MPFDPTKPADGSLADAAELRNQLNALKQAIDDLAAVVAALPTVDGVNDAIVANASGPLTGISPPDFTFSNPPTQAEVQAMADYLNQMYVALSRT